MKTTNAVATLYDVNVLTVSPTNPRGKVDPKEIADLVKSVKEQGVLQPIIVREIADPKSKTCRTEVVSGHRRLAAAKLAGVKNIAAVVMTLSDDQAREVQIVENLQRSDIHPVDEGAAYRDLMSSTKLTVKDVAVRVGKSETYVRDRLVLTNLTAEGAKLYRAGTLPDGHAAAVARLSHEDQKAALKFCTDTYHFPTLKALKEHVETKISSPLAYQPWVGNAVLEKLVGPCDGCQPNVATLFGSVRVGACTSLACWKRKMEKFIDAACKADKLTRISGDYSNPPKGAKSRSEYAVVPAKGKGRCKSAHRAVYVDGANVGKVVDVCTDRECKTHAGQTHDAPYQRTEKEKANAKAELEKSRKAKDAAWKKHQDAGRGASWPLSLKQLDVIVASFVEGIGFNDQRALAKRLDLIKKGQDGVALDAAIKRHYAKLSPAKKAQFALTLSSLLKSGSYGAF